MEVPFSYHILYKQPMKKLKQLNQEPNSESPNYKRLTKHLTKNPTSRFNNQQKIN